MKKRIIVVGSALKYLVLENHIKKNQIDVEIEMISDITDYKKGKFECELLIFSGNALEKIKKEDLFNFLKNQNNLKVIAHTESELTNFNLEQETGVRVYRILSFKNLLPDLFKRMEQKGFGVWNSAVAKKKEAGPSKKVPFIAYILIAFIYIVLVAILLKTY